MPLKCHRCGYELTGVPELGKAVLCPECQAVNSFDPELHAKLTGTDRLPATYARLNSFLFFVVTLAILGKILTGILTMTPMQVLSAALALVGLVALRLWKRHWFVQEKKPETLSR